MGRNQTTTCVEKKRDEVLAELGRHLPDTEFSADILRSTEEAEKLIEKDGDRFDGYLVYMTALWTKIEQVFARKVHPVVIADDLYAGSGGILSAHSVIRKESMPVLTVASSNFRDTVEAVRLFDVMRRLREARILVVSDRERDPGDADRVEPLGATLVQLRSDRLHEYYSAVDERGRESGRTGCR